MKAVINIFVDTGHKSILVAKEKYTYSQSVHFVSSIISNHLYYIKMSLFSCSVIGNIVLTEPLLRGHLSYMTTFLYQK